MRDGWTKNVLAGSRIAERNLIGNNRRFELTSLLRYQADTPDALPLRLTFKPLVRADGIPMFPGGDPLQNTPPFIPGFRGGWSGIDVAMPAPQPYYGAPVYAAVEWGVGDAPINRMLVDWPVCGASVELVASNVQVYSALGSDPDASAGGASPAVACELGPSQGMGYNDEPLSLTQPATTSLGNARSYAIPEFARSVILYLTDTIDPGDFMDVAFTGPFASVSVVSTRIDFAQRGPIELQIPGSAALMRINAANPVAGMEVDLVWRIAP